MIRSSIKLAIHGICCRECRTVYKTEVQGGLVILHFKEIKCAERKYLERLTHQEKG